jgi:signal transduction histidine kinase
MGPLASPRWVRLGMAGILVLVIAPTLLLETCWCVPSQWLARLLLVSFVAASFLLELVWGRLPRWVFALSIAAPVGWLIFSDNASVAPLFLLLMVGWVAYSGSLRDAWLATALATAAVLGYVRFDTPDRWLPWLLGIAAVALMTRLFVVQESLVRQLRAAQADLAQQAVAAERRRIAGEIHDIAAHALAVTLLHLTGARLQAQREGSSPRLIDSLAEAERLGRQSLDDVRRTVGLLQDDAAGLAAPLPGAHDIRALVEQYRSAGLDVALELHGPLDEIAPATGLALYRIVQESLANVVKHAPGVAAQVLLELGGGVRLRICNPLAASPTVAAGQEGHGLGGMRERARLLGGSLRAGPSGSEWLVECAIPGEARP